jgi:hypothetical protein
MPDQIQSRSTLKLRSCFIRRLSPDDAAAVQRYEDNRKICSNLRDLFPHPYSLEDARAFLCFVEKEEPNTTFVPIATDVRRFILRAEIGASLRPPFSFRV